MSSPCLHKLVYTHIRDVKPRSPPIPDNAAPTLEPFAIGGPRLAEQAYQALRAAIQEGRLEPGQRVPELELCAWLKVSRTPVREALRRLQSDGMLVHAPGGGLAVAHHDVRALAELYDVRESLEGTAAGLAARHADPAEIQVLEAMLGAHRDLPDAPRVHARENKLFHERIYSAAHNRFLLKSLQDLHNAVALLGRTTFAAPGRIEQAWAEHAGIVAAIARRDPAEAETLARAHVRRGYQIRLMQVVEEAQAGPQARIEEQRARN